MNKNFAITFLGVVLFISLVANYFLLERAVKGSYALDFQPRLIMDTKVLSASTDSDITSSELIQFIQNLDTGIQIEQLQNKKSQWNWSGPTYPIAVRVAGNLTFYFSSDEKLERIDHWLAENSPLYERAR